MAVLGPSATAYAIAHDGYLTVEGRKWDAILVEAAERGADSAFLFAQCYRPKKGMFGKFGVEGNAALAGTTDKLLG